MKWTEAVLIYIFPTTINTSLNWKHCGRKYCSHGSDLWSQNCLLVVNNSRGECTVHVRQRSSEVKETGACWRPKNNRKLLACWSSDLHFPRMPLYLMCIVDRHQESAQKCLKKRLRTSELALESACFRFLQNQSNLVIDVCTSMGMLQTGTTNISFGIFRM